MIWETFNDDAFCQISNVNINVVSGTCETRCRPWKCCCQTGADMRLVTWPWSHTGAVLLCSTQWSYHLIRPTHWSEFLSWMKQCLTFTTLIVKLLAKSKLKSLPYNHTDHLPTHPPTHPPTHNFKSSLYKSIQVLHQHMRYH